MKISSRQHIIRAETLQLIILHCLYSHGLSRDIIFQGGTSVRWCYGLNRFSEDLDFVTSLGVRELQDVFGKVAAKIRKEAVAHFGPGVFSVKEKESASSYKVMVRHAPAGRRYSVSVRLEFELLALGYRPEYRPRVMATLPPVAGFFNQGHMKIPTLNTVILVETATEILSDKIRALLERPYLKGRDLYDIWFLVNTLQVRVDKKMIGEKLAGYRVEFRARRSPDFFASLADNNAARKEVVAALNNDLQRFLPAPALAAVLADDCREIIQAVSKLFLDLDLDEIH